MTSYQFNDSTTNWTITAKTIQSKTGETLTLNGTNGTSPFNITSAENGSVFSK